MNEEIKIVIEKLQELECPVCLTKVKVSSIYGNEFKTETCGHEDVEVLIQKVINPPLR